MAACPGISRDTVRVVLRQMKDEDLIAPTGKGRGQMDQSRQTASTKARKTRAKMTITIAKLLKDSAYKLGQFKPEQIKALESSITIKENGKKAAYGRTIRNSRTAKSVPAGRRIRDGPAGADTPAAPPGAYPEKPTCSAPSHCCSSFS
ncbi:MAG: hypothetical protein M5R42_05340 [Rhodocyclaceae bacterium]|nr:hypothetical protein [Rhodocyclaceae bacterium]